MPTQSTRTSRCHRQADPPPQPVSPGSPVWAAARMNRRLLRYICVCVCIHTHTHTHTHTHAHVVIYECRCVYAYARKHMHICATAPPPERSASALCAADAVEALRPSTSTAAPTSPAAAGTGPAAQRYVVAGAGMPAVNGECVLEYLE